MTWTVAPLPAALTLGNLPQLVGRGIGSDRWIVSDGTSYTTTADFVTFTPAQSFPAPYLVSNIGATYGTFAGGSWFVGQNFGPGYIRSTDGQLAQTWEYLDPQLTVGSGERRAALSIFGTSTGRLVARALIDSFQQRLSYSDDNGVSWTQSVSSIAPIENGEWYFHEHGGWVISCGFSGQPLLSSNSGTTWSLLPSTPVGPGWVLDDITYEWVPGPDENWEQFSGCARIGSTIVVTRSFRGQAFSAPDTLDTPRISTNGGSTWAPIAGFAAGRYFLRQAFDGQMYLLRENDDDCDFWYSTDGSTWTSLGTVPATGWGETSHNRLVVEGHKVVFLTPDSSFVYTIDRPGTAPPEEDGPPRTEEASGFSPVAFGTPGTPLFATGFLATTIPVQLAVYNRTEIATGRSLQGIFGVPYGFLPLFDPAENTTTQASGFNAVRFGQHLIDAPIAVTAAGVRSTALGSPQSGGRFSASSIGMVVSFGLAATVASITRAAGSRLSAVFGAAVSALERFAASIPTRTRFGPRPQARLGALAIISHPAEGFANVAQVGQAQALAAFNALHLSPPLRFGSAAVRKTPSC